MIWKKTENPPEFFIQCRQNISPNSNKKNPNKENKHIKTKKGLLRASLQLKDSKVNLLSNRTMLKIMDHQNKTSEDLENNPKNLKKNNPQKIPKTNSHQRIKYSLLLWATLLPMKNLTKDSTCSTEGDKKPLKDLFKWDTLNYNKKSSTSKDKIK